MKAVILAAGRGKRMRGLCSAVPKPLLPLANRAIMSIIFSRVREMGVSEVALVVGFEGDKLKSFIGDGSRYGLRVTYVWQEKQLGTGHATLLCQDFVGRDPFVLIFGDILTRSDNYPAMAKLFRSGDCDAVLTVFPVEDPSNGAAVDVRDGRVVNIVEKPPPGSMLNAYNNAGIFLWPPDVFDLVRNLKLSPRGEYEFTDCIIAFIKQGRRLAAFELQGYWENITDPETCIRMNQNLLLEELPPAHSQPGPGTVVGTRTTLDQCRVAGGVRVGSGCKIEGSILESSCTIGDDCSIQESEIQAGAKIGDRCRLGPYASVGEGAVVESGTALGPNASVGKNCRVGPDSTVSSSILLPGSTVGANSALVHVMLNFDTNLAAGRRLTGTPDKAFEILSE